MVLLLSYIYIFQRNRTQFWNRHTLTSSNSSTTNNTLPTLLPFYQTTQSILIGLECLVSILAFWFYLHGKRHHIQYHVQLGAKLFLIGSIMMSYRTLQVLIMETWMVKSNNHHEWNEDHHGKDNKHWKSVSWDIMTWLSWRGMEMVVPAVLARVLLDRLYMRTKRVKFKQG